MKKVCCWDLEGPISVIDFAAEIGRMLSEKSELNLQKYDMGEFFFMISNYDDYIIDIPGVKEKLNIPEYQPGDTLRLMAPFYVACFSDEELNRLAKKNLEVVIEDLDNFFWKGEESDYVKIMNRVKVRGGKRKELAVEEISKRTNTPIGEMIALGDSITDINMLQRLKDEDGIAVSFNGNRFTAERANVAVTTPNNLGVLPIFEAKDNISEFLGKWESDYKDFSDDPKKIKKGIISDEIRNLFIENNFVPELNDLSNKTHDQINEIIAKQEKMRKYVRGWAGNLG